jgi:hypothetical protein
MERRSLRILVVVAHPHDFVHCSSTCGIHISMVPDSALRAAEAQV